MASNRPRPRVGASILVGLLRVIAASVIAIVASAALAELAILSVDYARILPVMLTGEAILYILILGGGSVRAPIMLTAIVLGFALRALIAIAASAVSPQAGRDFVSSFQFYHAAYWPAAIAQVFLVGLALRLVRPLIATRKRRLTRRPGPATPEAAREDPEEEERREVLLGALAEAPDQPPVRPTVLEERQIGDLAEAMETPLSDAEVEQALALPFDEEAAEEGEESREESAEQPADEPVEEVAEEEVAAEEPVAATEEEPAAEAAPVAEAEVEPEAAAVVGEVGEDTATFAPVGGGPSQGEEMAPPSNLQGMVDVISRAAGEDTDVRVWRTPDGRTIVAAVPAGTPAAGTGGHANSLVSAHLEICAWLGTDGTCTQIASGPIGAWALRAVDQPGSVMLMMASRGEAAAGRLQVAAERTAEAVLAMVEAAGEPEGAEAAEVDGVRVPIAPEPANAAAVNEAARRVNGRFAGGWSAWRGPHRRIIAVHGAPGADPQELGQKAARLVGPIERFADAVALEAPEWIALGSGERLLALHWAERDGEPAVLVALTEGGAALGRVRWELGEIAREMAN